MTREFGGALLPPLPQNMAGGSRRERRCKVRLFNLLMRYLFRLARLV
jgi:hypothetical protein